MKFKFKFWIFQNGEFNEELEIVEEFSDATDLARRLIAFATMESRERLHQKVKPLYSGGTINLPKTRDGYGPMTSVIIRDIIPL